MKRTSRLQLRLLVLALAAAALWACGDKKLAVVQPQIRVTATHVDAEGNRLLDFGKVAVLDTRTLIVLVENLGRAPLTIESVELTDPAGVFSIQAEYDKLEVPAARSVEIPVTFRPAALADYEGSFLLKHNDKEQPDASIRLTGVGSTVGRIEIDPESIDFGVVGERMQEVRTLTIRSVGTGPLVIEAVEFFESPPEFSILGSVRVPARLPPPADGQPGGSVDLRIVCAPTAATPGTELSGTIRLVTTDPDRREVLIPLTAVVNRAPLAVIEVEGGVHVAEAPIGLDATKSTDPDGDLPLTYTWRVYDKPFGATAILADETAAITTLLVDMPGEYEIGLDVADSRGLYCYPPGGDDRIPCARKVVKVVSDVDLQVELIWDHAITDLDLHLLENDAEINSSGDCFWANKHPDFGIFGDDVDNPVMTHESLKGFGPETIVFAKPSGGKYHVEAIFAKPNGSTTPSTRATVRVFIFGILEAELTKTLDTAQQRWDVLTIDWPSAVVTPINVVHPAVTP